MLTRISVNVLNLSKTYSSCMTYLINWHIQLTYLQSGLYPELRGVRFTSILKEKNKSHITTRRQISLYNMANKLVTNWIDDKSIPLYCYISNICIWWMCVSNLHWSLLHQEVLYKGFTSMYHTLVMALSEKLISPFPHH